MIILCAVCQHIIYDILQAKDNHGDKIILWTESGLLPCSGKYIFVGFLNSVEAGAYNFTVL